MSVTRWGILTTANINRVVIAGARAADVEVVAVASREQARAYAREFDGGAAPARPRRRARPGEDDRGALRGGGRRQKPKWTFVKYQSADVAHSPASTDAIVPPNTGSTQRGCRRSCTKNTFTTNTP